MSRLRANKSLKRIRDGVSHPLVGCTTHSTPTGCHGRNLNAHLAHSVNCDGHPMNKSVFHLIHTSLTPCSSTTSEGWKHCLAWMGTTYQEFQNRVHATASALRHFFKKYKEKNSSESNDTSFKVEGHRATEAC